MAEKCSVYLYQSDVHEFRDACIPSPGWNLALESFLAESPFQLWLCPNQQSTPNWKNFLSQLVDLSFLSDDSSSSALLLIRVNRRMFGLSFSYGHFRIPKSRVVFDFGLFLAGENIDQANVSAMSFSGLGPDPLSGNLRSRRPVQLSFLQGGYDSQRITALRTRRPTENGIDSEAGGISYSLRLPEDPSSLPNVLSTLLDRYLVSIQSPNSYQLRRSTRIYLNSPLGQECEQSLLASYLDGNLDQLQLTLPSTAHEFGSPTQYQVTFGERAIEIDEISWESLETFWSNGRNRESRDLEELIIAPIFDGRTDSGWKLRDCLSFETIAGDSYVLLVEGRWELFATNHQEVIDARLRSILQDSSHIQLSPWDEALNEDGYIGTYANNPSTKVMHRCNWRGVTHHDILEICDLVTKTGQLIHIKDGTHTAAISQVTSQAINSASAICKRFEVLSFLQGHEQGFTDGSQRGPYREVVMAIATPQNGDLVDILPFAARLRLVEACRTLNTLGMTPRIVRVDKCREILELRANLEPQNRSPVSAAD